MKKPKIASLFASLKIGWGVEKVQANLSLGLSKRGYEFVHILLEDSHPRYEHWWEIIRLDHPFIKGFWLRKIWRLFWDARKVKTITKHEKVDILIGQGDYFFMVSGLAKLFGFKGKTVAVVHTTIGIRPKIITRILRFFLKLHDKIILISKEEYGTFHRKYHFPTENLGIIYNTIQKEGIDNLLQEEITDLDFTPFTFINIGRLTYQKGQDRLLNAFEAVYTQNPNTQLVILGDGELKEQLIQQVQQLKSKQAIHFLGNQKNIYPYLAKSDCFVLSSRFEGFPMVLLEALYVWIPIIATNCPTWPTELLTSNTHIHWKAVVKTDLGYLVDQKEASINLAAAMLEISKNPWISYDVEFYKDNFSQTRNINAWEEVIQSLL